MTLIAGFLYRDPARRADPEAARAMAEGLGLIAEPRVVASGPLALVIGGGGEAAVGGAAADSLVAGDLDLVNGETLRRRTGHESALETIRRLHAAEGPSALRRLEGAFAVALWSPASRTLALAVDQLGIKRLYYAERADLVAFATHSAALRALPGFGAAADPTAIYHYLNFGFVPAPHSAFSGVRRLPPGNALVVADGKATESAYWDLAYVERPMPPGEAARELYRGTAEAVSRGARGVAPKELGAFLSGGTDSSTVVGLLGAATGERVNAFSIGFQEPRYDEMSWAELSARHFKAAHYTQVITAGEALGAVPGLVQAFDEPFGNNSAVGTFFCARLARESGVKVLLAGDGGDEIFGGNERYRTDRIFGRYQLLPRWVRRGLLEPALRLAPPVSVLGKAQRYVRRANIPNPRRFYSYEFFFAQDGRPLLTSELVEAAGAEAPWQLLERHHAAAAPAGELNRLLYLDMKLTLADNDLLKVTRTAELAGIDVRFPLLDVPLVALASALPADLKVRGLEKRYLFRRAFAGLLAPETLAKEKHGFGVPTSLWLRSDPGFRALAGDTLLSARARQRGYFRPGAVEDLMARHAADDTPFYGDLLWNVLMLELWHRRHLDGVAGA